MRVRKMRERERDGGRESGRREREKVPDRADLDCAGVGNAPMDFTRVAIPTAGATPGDLYEWCNSGTRI